MPPTASTLSGSSGCKTRPRTSATRLSRSMLQYPSKTEPSRLAHTTGGAVDLTIVGPHGTQLAMGTEFDAFTHKTTTDWFEHAPKGEADADVLKNRRLLFHVMRDAGFVNLPSEWWHYSYGDTNWARATGQPVRYDGRFGKAEFEVE